MEGEGRVDVRLRLEADYRNNAMETALYSVSGGEGEGEGRRG